MQPIKNDSEATICLVDVVEAKGKSLGAPKSERHPWQLADVQYVVLRGRVYAAVLWTRYNPQK